jgi:O-methyltransferase
MHDNDLQKLVDDATSHVLQGKGPVAILSLSDVAIRFVRSFRDRGLLGSISGVYSASSDASSTPSLEGVRVLALPELQHEHATAIVVAADAEKEAVILSALPHIIGTPRLIVAGYAHYSFRDALFDQIRAHLTAPSLANGYPNSLIHIYQCLRNGARLRLSGAVVELGTFKGGTTLFIAQVIEQLGMRWPVLTFDSFSGFPPRRTPLDMYDEPECVFTDIEAVRSLFAGRDIQIVTGDITQTCHQLAQLDLVLTFFDTDNYSPAQAALAIVRERTVLNGAIVFDHFTGVDRFRYTLGERLAALPLLDDERYFNLHGTGVFIRQR